MGDLATGPGMLKGQSVLCISSIDWDFIWQGHQQIMSTLAANGNKVLFIENTGVRRPNLRDIPRLRQRLRNWRRGTRGFRQERENLFVYSPLALPFPYSRIARVINRTIIVRAIRRWMAALEIQRPIVWTFLPTPLARDLIKGVDPELVIYYCIDDLEASSPGARGIRNPEIKLFREADLVFVTSARLQERAQLFRDQVDVFPFAVDFERFSAVRNADGDPPADLADLKGPIVGYVGGLHRFVDQQLITATARKLPEVTFAFVGPPQCDVSRLASEPNVRLLGKRSHEELPSYIKAFDVGTVPYVFDDYTANVYPTKLNEYLAMGVPVVATGLPEITRFNEKHGEVVAVANDAEAFASEVLKALNEPNGPQARRRIEVARENSWDSRLDGMTAIIERTLRDRRARKESWDSRLRRIYRVGRRRLVGTAAGLAALYVLVFHTPLVWWIAAPLRVSESPQPADAIVVFAGGVGESGDAGGGYQERVGHAVQLYRAGLAPRMVLSSGYVFAFREAEIMRNLAVNLGVPPDVILLEQAAGNTLENVVFVRDLLRQDSVDSALLVSSPYHMRRAVMTWREQAPEIAVVASPVPVSQYYARDEGVRLQHIRGIAWEYAAIFAYWLRGWL